MLQTYILSAGFEFHGCGFSHFSRIIRNKTQICQQPTITQQVRGS